MAVGMKFTIETDIHVTNSARVKYKYFILIPDEPDRQVIAT